MFTSRALLRASRRMFVTAGRGGGGERGGHTPKHGVNKVILVGRVGAEPELRKFGRDDANSKVSFPVATATRRIPNDNDGQQGSDGHGDEHARGPANHAVEWHKVAFFNNPMLTDIVDRFMPKGSLVYVEGELSTRRWDKKDGSVGYITEVIIPKFSGQLRILSSPRNKDEHEE